MLPTKGRTVLYQPDWPPEELQRWDAPFVGVVTAVRADGTVALAVFPPVTFSGSGARQGVMAFDNVPQADEARLIVDDEPQPGHSWRWPPRA